MNNKKKQEIIENMHKIYIFKTIKVKQQAYSTMWDSKLALQYFTKIKQDLRAKNMH